MFEGLSSNFKSGEFVVVDGPNGAGKTSLLRILAGLAAPLDGEVLFNNQPINDDLEAFKSDLLYIGHSAAVKPELSALENLQFSLALHGEDPSLALEGLKQVGLSAFDDAMAATLSAGQKRKIALAQLWLTSANIWILDEPFTAIDTKGVQQLEEQILCHVDNGGIVILTTHQNLSIPENRLTNLKLEYRF